MIQITIRATIVNPPRMAKILRMMENGFFKISLFSYVKQSHGTTTNVIFYDFGYHGLLQIDHVAMMEA